MKRKRVSKPRKESRVTARVRFVSGSRHPKGSNADVVWSELNRIKALRGGALVPADVVAAAQDPASPLHTFFQWSDATAAHEWRLHQARRLLQSIEIIPGKDRPAVRAMLVVTEGEEDAYRSTADVMRNEEWRTQVLRRAYGELLSWRNRYADMLEFGALFAAVDSFPVPPKMKVK